MKSVLSLFSGIGGLCHRRQFDILCGGFPCSSTSNAGDKKGLNDPRSGLWQELMDYRGDAPKDAYVFKSRNGKNKPLHRQNVDPIIKDAGERAGLMEKVSCHWLKHSHATHNAERGTPVPLIQETMGHVDISTTAGYIHIRPGDSSALHLPRV